MEALLRRHHYAELGRPDRGLVRRFLQQLSGLSRAQTTRLIGQFLRQRTVCPTAYRRRRFPTRYTPADIVLLRAWTRCCFKRAIQVPLALITVVGIGRPVCEVGLDPVHQFHHH